MSTDNFLIKIFTPNGLLLEKFSSGVTLPSKEGQIGILPQHTRYFGVLGTGVLEYVLHPSNKISGVAVSEGVCAFDDNCLTVVADLADLPDTCDIDLIIEKRELESIIAKGSFDDSKIFAAKKRLLYVDALQQITKM